MTAGASFCQLNPQSEIRIPQSVLARPEPLTVFGRRDEGFDHLGGDEVAAEGVQLVEPEVEPGGVWVAPEIAEVLHRDEGGVELARLQLLGLGDLTQNLRARQSCTVESRNERVAEGARGGE